MVSFDQLAERTARIVARPWFFAVVLVAMVAWIPTLVLWDTGASDLFIDALTNPLSLLLLVLLQNSQYRSDKVLDDRQDEMERAMALLLHRFAEHERDQDRQHELRDTARRLVENAERSTTISSAGVGDEHP